MSGAPTGLADAAALQPNEVVSGVELTRQALRERADRPAHVIGAASAEGVATARFLARLGFSRVVLHDMRPREELRKGFRTTHGAYGRVEQDALWDELRPLLDAGCFGERYLEGVADAHDGTVVLGQGWYLDARNRELVLAALPQSALVTSMSALYFAFAPGPVAAVTGTNGKSTTVALCEHLLQRGGVPHATAGNERSSRQFLPDIEALAPGTMSLLEVSNRQLLQLRGARPDVAAITALTPDHLEEHGGFDGYAAAKRRLFTWQHDTDVAIANADDANALAAAAGGKAQLVRCGIGALDAPSVSWVGDELVATHVPLHDGAALRGSRVVARREHVQLPGAHNLRNVAVAVALALACGADPDAMADAVAGFSGKSLRLELLATLDGGAVEVYSDIKSTTPEATVAALSALAGGHPAALVVGGEDKGLDYAPLALAIDAADVAAFAVPGTATDALERELHARGITLPRHERLADALGAAVESVRGRATVAAAGRVIVSPGAAGFWTSQLQGQPSLRSLVRDLHGGAGQA